MRTLQLQANDTHVQVKLLQYKSIDAKARSRRSNLIFRGLSEELGEEPVSIIKSLLCDKLKLDADEIYIQRAHRIGRLEQRRRFGDAKHRPIIVAFRDFQDKETVLPNWRAAVLALTETSQQNCWKRANPYGPRWKK